MKTGVIVVTHGGAGTAMIKAVAEKVGEIEGIVTVDVALGDSPLSVQQRVDAAVEALVADEVLFLTDLGGATPFNVCCKSCGGNSVVVTGLNLPMLFKLTTAD